MTHWWALAQRSAGEVPVGWATGAGAITRGVVGGGVVAGGRVVGAAVVTGRGLTVVGVVVVVGLTVVDVVDEEVVDEDVVDDGKAAATSGARTGTAALADVDPPATHQASVPMTTAMTPAAAPSPTTRPLVVSQRGIPDVSAHSRAALKAMTQIACTHSEPINHNSSPTKSLRQPNLPILTMKRRPG